MMKINPKHLPWLAALTQTLQYGHVGYIYAGTYGAFSVGMMGALISLVVAYAAARINDVAQNRQKSSWVFFVLLLTISPVFVGVGMYHHLSMLGDSSARYIVAGIWGLIPDGSIALSGVITGLSLVELRSSPKKTATRIATSKPKTGKTGKQSQSNRSKTMSKNVHCDLCQNDMTQGKYNAHIANCKKTYTFVE